MAYGAIASAAAEGSSLTRDMAGAAVQYYNQKKLNRQAQTDTQQNMKLQKQLNLQQQYDSVRNYTSALRNAGLNPALASSGVQLAQGVSSAAGNAGQAAMPENSAPAYLQAYNAIAKQESEIENTKANTELQKAETDLKKQEVENKQQDVKESQSRIDLNGKQSEMLAELTQKYGTESLILGTEYDRMLKEDSVAHAALMEYCDRRIAGAQTEADRDYWSSLRAIGRNGKFNAGALMAMKLFSETWNSLDETETEVGARAIMRFVQSLQASDDEYLDTIARLPVYQAKLIFGQTAEAFENAAFRKAYRQDLLPTEAEKLEEDIRVQKHNDPAGMLKDGDYLGFGVYAGSAVLRFGGTILAARQFGRGSSNPSTGNLGKGTSTSPAGTTPKIEASPKSSKVPQAALDNAVKNRLYSSIGAARTDKLWAGYRKSKANSFDEYLKSEGIGQKRNYTATDWMQ